MFKSMLTGAASLAAALCLTITPAAAQTGDATAFEEQVRKYLVEAAVQQGSDGYRLDDAQPVFLQALEASKSRLWTVRLQAGVSYRIVGVCDDDCSDLDMELYDDEGKFVANDIATDDIPWTDVTPLRSGVFTSRVWLANCTSEPCYVGAMVLRK